ARVAGLRVERVVAALAVRRPDRMHRRQVDDVEPELGELRQDRRHAREAAPGAREELVPGAEPRALAIDVDLELLRLRDAVPILDPRLERLLDGELVAAEQHGAFGELAREVFLAGLDLAAHLVLPRGDAVVPRDDAEAVAAAALDLERARPAVVSERLHGRLLPLPPLNLEAD